MNGGSDTNRIRTSGEDLRGGWRKASRDTSSWAFLLGSGGSPTGRASARANGEPAHLRRESSHLSAAARFAVKRPGAVAMGEKDTVRKKRLGVKGGEIRTSELSWQARRTVGITGRDSRRTLFFISY